MLLRNYGTVILFSSVISTILPQSKVILNKVKQNKYYLFLPRKKFSTACYYIETNNVCEEMEQQNSRINAQISVLKGIRN